LANVEYVENILQPSNVRCAGKTVKFLENTCHRLPERNCGGEVALYQNAPLPFTFAFHFCPSCCYRRGGQSVVPYNANSFRIESAD